MQDEHFQRQWAQSHDRFSHDVDINVDKLRSVLNAVSARCASALLRRADATAKALIVGFISGAALGSALLATAAVTPSVQNGADVAVPTRTAPVRVVLA